MVSFTSYSYGTFRSLVHLKALRIEFLNRDVLMQLQKPVKFGPVACDAYGFAALLEWSTGGGQIMFLMLEVWSRRLYYQDNSLLCEGEQGI